MRFLFIRHGEPGYINDCLTPIGFSHGGSGGAAHIKGLGDELKVQQKSI